MNLRLVDFMDARPLPQADIEASLSVMPRYRSRLTFPDEDEPPVPLLEADPRFQEVLSATGVTDGDGHVLVNFNDADVFRRVARKERPEMPSRPVDAVGFVRVGARFLGAVFDPRLLASDVARSSQLELTLPLDLGMSIVGHTTASSVRLWFHVPFEPVAGQRFTCSVATVPKNAAVLLPGPVRGGTELGRTFPVEFERAANTAVVDVDGLPADSAHDYSLRVEVGLRRFGLATGRFVTPAAAQPGLSFAFGSCHLPFVAGTTSDLQTEAARRTLTHWQRLADRRDFEFLVLTGDQIYGDGIEDKWPANDDFTRYVLRYRQLWAHRPTRQVLRTGPTYMILDDHDVADDFGIANLDDLKVQGALDAYRLFQHVHGPSELVGPPFHYSFRWGPAAFFVMDGRTQRGEGTPVFGSRQLRDLEEWATRADTRAADVIFFVAPVPLALLPTEIIRKVSEELTEEVFAAGGATLGSLVGLGVGAAVAGPFGAAAGAGIGAAVLGSIGYAVGEEVFENFLEGNMLLDADLGERWDLRGNQPDLAALLGLLFDLANGVGEDPPRKRAVFILAGDIHAATMHGIRALPKHGDQRHQANPLIIQLTSSAISHKPVNSTLWAQAVSRIDEDVDLDLKDLNDLTVLSGGVDWDSLGAGAIDVDDVFGKGKAQYFLDPDLERRYLTQYAGLLMERTVGFVNVERRDPQRRIYRFRLTIEGETRPLESRFELDLDADEVVQKTDAAAFVRHTVPRSLQPLRPIEVEVTMRNTGVMTWGNGYALDIVQTVWGVDRVAVGQAVRPGREHTFRFRIAAPSSGTFFFSARMVRVRTAFGQGAGPVTVRATPTPGGGGGGQRTCQELRSERQRLDGELRGLQAELAGASPAEKQFLNREIARTRAAITAVGRLMTQLGCN